MNRKDRRAAAKIQSGGGKNSNVLQKAIDLHLAGKLNEAYPLYREVLDQEPNNPDALHMTGVFASDTGNHESGAELILQALRINSDNPDYQNSLGNCLFALGMFEEAAAWYQQATALNPHSAQTWNNLGNALRKLDLLEDAEQAYKNAIDINPFYDDPYNNIGVLLKDSGRQEEALHYFQKALAINPAFGEAKSNLGSLLQETGKFDQAAAAISEAASDAPHSAEARNNYGLSLLKAGKFEQALEELKQAVALNPNMPTIWNNLGLTHKALNQSSDAIDCFQKAIDLDRESVSGWSNLGIVYLNLNNYARASECFDQALAHDPENISALINKGLAMEKLGRLEQAIEHLDKAYALSPNHDWLQGARLHTHMAACDWREYNTIPQLIERVRTGEKAAMPFTLIGLPVEAQDQLICAKTYVQDRCPAMPSPGRTAASNDKIRIAYISSDFYDHATTQLLAGVIENHDRSTFEISAFSFSPNDNSAARERIVKAFGDNFYDVNNLSNTQIAQMLADKSIDIAIDLKGMTQGNRLGIFAHRAAPIQIGYLGYPATSGADFIDYFIADHVTITPDIRASFSEKIVYMPHTYQPNDSNRPVADNAGQRQDHDLPADGFVFCAFNSTYKITPENFAVWMEILKSVDKSILWLIDGGSLQQQNLRAAATTHGVDPARLIFAKKKPAPEHLARHRHADLFLDNLPCNAHTTAADALWAGLPLLTCAGNSFTGRVASSLLNAAGLQELITTSWDDYKQKAIALAHDPAMLAALKNKAQLGRTSSALFDTKRYTKNLEQAFRVMWQRQKDSLPPQDFDVTE